MKSSNKNIREQRTARTTRLKSRIEASQQLIQQLNPQQFQIPLPEFHNTQTHIHKSSTKNTIFSPSFSGFEGNQLDERKQIIKQKIKFRVKQELWALMKKSSQKNCISQSLEQSSTPRDRNRTYSGAFIMGRSFTRFDRNNSRKLYYDEAKKQKSSTKNLSNGKAEDKQELKHRRAWSSSVRMRDKDKALLEKQLIRVNRSLINIQKMESYEIEPWKAFQDPQHQLME